MMGARISGTAGNTIPLKFYITDQINSITYELPVPSAQVKGAILLAGLYSDIITKIIEVKSNKGPYRKNAWT